MHICGSTVHSPHSCGRTAIDLNSCGCPPDPAGEGAAALQIWAAARLHLFAALAAEISLLASSAQRVGAGMGQASSVGSRGAAAAAAASLLSAVQGRAGPPLLSLAYGPAGQQLLQDLIQQAQQLLDAPGHRHWGPPPNALPCRMGQALHQNHLPQRHGVRVAGRLDGRGPAQAGWCTIPART